MPRWKLYLIHFLNIAGLGPIFGVIQGALFGPAAFLWITLGTIFIGAVHDFFSGFLSLRNDGFTMPDIVSKYLGNTTQKLVAVFTVITCILIASVFSTGSASLIGNLTNTPVAIWTLIIFIYILIATMFPVDKIIGRVYPVFGVLFIVMIIMMIGGLFMHPGYTIPEFTTQGLYLTDKPIFPYLFVTIAWEPFQVFMLHNPRLLQDAWKPKKMQGRCFSGQWFWKVLLHSAGQHCIGIFPWTATACSNLWSNRNSWSA